ncbi:hypothetical protein OE09_0776 [Flavobacteriaceae bacterium MAR_2010_72]|nr:hypothetical protein OE09_0776 [Flavobacteriaceae bacterium MAR_2010_72]
MNKSLLSLLFLALIAVSCKKEIDPFLISKHNIGLLTDSTQVKDLELVFPNDSIVKSIKGDEYSGNTNDINIFEKGGKELLILAPDQVLDSTAVIESVQIMDSRYRTEKGISTLSTFKDIDQNYKISRINNLINSIVITVDEINASFTIDKKELPSDLRFDLSLKIEKIQIPDRAKIKYFFVYWN